MPRLIRAAARTAVVAGTATAVSNRVSRRQANRWSDQAEEQAYEQQQPAPVSQSAPNSGTDDKLAQLRELGELKAAGILNDAEFETQKAKILAN
jgi:Short C-terminal domain